MGCLAEVGKGFVIGDYAPIPFRLAERVLKELDEMDIHHSCCCTNWAQLDNSQHQCALCDLRDEVMAYKGKKRGRKRKR